MASIPMKYADVATHAEPPKIAPAIIVINGTFAPHGIKVVVIMVIRRSRSFSIVLDAIIPGIPQPVPIRTAIRITIETVATHPRTGQSDFDLL